MRRSVSAIQCWRRPRKSSGTFGRVCAAQPTRWSRAARPGVRIRFGGRPSAAACCRARRRGYRAPVIIGRHAHRTVERRRRLPRVERGDRAVVRRGEGVLGHHIVGFRHGWRGVIGGEVVELTVASTRGLLYRGGTMLGTSRTNPYKQEGAVDKVRDTLRRERIEVLIAVGGEDTLGVARSAVPATASMCVGVPKTIDNDLSATDYTFGFDTAVQIATEAIDRLHTTAESHDRVIIVEVMGRHAGWIALHSGLGGGADAILIPEVPFDLDEIVAQLEHRHAARRELVDRRRRRGRDASRRARWRRSTRSSTSSVTCGSEASRRGSRPSSRSAPGSTRAWSCSAICCVAARRRPSTGSSRRGSASRPSTPLDDRASDVMVALPWHRDRACPARRRGGRAQDRPARALRRGRGLLRVSLVSGHAMPTRRSCLRAARARAARGQPLPWAQPRTRTSSACSAGRSRRRRSSPPAAPSSADRHVHSLHAYFLRPGDPNVPIVFEVDRIRDGRSFTTRRVVAIQHGRAIFNLAASFQVLEPGPDHAAPMPQRARPRRAADLPRAARAVPRPVRRRHGRLAHAGAPDRLTAGRGPEVARARTRARRRRTCGSAPTVSCPTIRWCTRASSRTRRTSPSSTPRRSRTRSATRPGTTRWRVSTTRCGSTGRSAPTTGSSTARRARRRPARAASRSVTSSRATAASRSP